MSTHKKIELLISRLRTLRIFKIIYWITRVSMSLTFIASGLRKLPGVHFTSLPDSNPVGLFFHVMHDLGFYWHFIGYYQILTGLLLLVNRFVAFSSLLMFPVTVNILLISFALNMKGTPIITTAMLLANLFLLLWHFEKYKSIFKKTNE